MAATQTTTLGRRWLIRMVLFILLCAGFAAYSLYDAMKAYPDRARAAASLALFNYLDAETQQGKTYPTLEAFEPRAELERLRAQRDTGTLGGVDQHKYDWLEQTRLAGDLDTPEFRARAGAVRTNTHDAWGGLKSQWQKEGAAPASVAPLSSYDIPVQWLLFVLCAGVTAWLLVLLLSVARRKYGWEPGEQRLSLPDGSTLVPAEVEDFDKRRWDKFLIFLKIKPGHATHGGREIKLDLYRHHPLEDWVLAMEKTAFPERAAPAPSPAA
jgi:hypothetical protein